MKYNKSVYQTLRKFWNALNDPAKAYFRDTMMQSMSRDFPPKKANQEEISEFEGKFTAVERFKKYIGTLDFLDEAEGYWLNFDYWAALDDMYEKGFKWHTNNNFEVKDVRLQYLGE